MTTYQKVTARELKGLYKQLLNSDAWRSKQLVVSILDEDVVLSTEWDDGMIELEPTKTKWYYDGVNDLIVEQVRKFPDRDEETFTLGPSDKAFSIGMVNGMTRQTDRNFKTHFLRVSHLDSALTPSSALTKGTQKRNGLRRKRQIVATMNEQGPRFFFPGQGADETNEAVSAGSKGDSKAGITSSKGKDTAVDEKKTRDSMTAAQSEDDNTEIDISNVGPLVPKAKFDVWMHFNDPQVSITLPSRDQTALEDIIADLTIDGGGMFGNISGGRLTREGLVPYPGLTNRAMSSNWKGPDQGSVWLQKWSVRDGTFQHTYRVADEDELIQTMKAMPDSDLIQLRYTKREGEKSGEREH